MDVQTSNRETGIVYTVDCLLVLPDGRVVLIRRGKPPFTGMLVMPGGHVELEDPTFEDACCRELYEELGLVGCEPESLDFLMELENSDPRPGRHISQVYVLRLVCGPFFKPDTSEVQEVVLLRPEELDPAGMGFSHYRAIARYMEMEGCRNGGIK